MAYKVGNLETNIIMNAEKATKGLQQVINQLNVLNTALATTMQSTSAIGNIGRMATRVQSTTTALGKVGDTVGDITSKSSGFNRLLSAGLKVGKLQLIIYSMARMGRHLAKLVQYGVDYTETLNLWQVAMKENLDLADKFINKMNKAYGISEETLMRTQAIFKNMIGGLGKVSEETSYKLSESITQMALDFSSLYNVTFENAINKFQAVLARQIRPIRSVSGYDISERSLFDIYTQIGGTKTMRQLNNTEKQLLSIYAILQQMNRAGATGDLAKTIDQFSNQSRMISENWKQLSTWLGISLKMLLENNKVLVNINAILITLSQVAKSIAYAAGYEAPNFIDNLFEDIQQTNDAADELEGKLLGFDKFRTLRGGPAAGEGLQIDQKLLDALTGYSTILDSVDNEAQQIADSWLKILGLTDENNDGLYETTENLKNFLKFAGQIIDVLKPILEYGIELNERILVFPYIIKNFNKIAETITNLLDSANKFFTETIPYAFNYAKNFVVSIYESVRDFFLVDLPNFFINFINWGIEKINILFRPINEIITKLGGKEIGLGYLQTKAYANGGIPDRGTLFYAGEAGAELVANNSAGQSGVMNMAQLQNAVRLGMLSALATASRGDKNGDIIVKIGDEELFTVITDTAKRRGYSWSKA